MEFTPVRDKLVPDLSPREELVLLARTLWREGYDDHLAGHITCNLGNGTLLCNPWLLTWDEIRPADVLRITLEGEVVEGDWPVPPGIPLHLELHRQREDVKWAVHNHPLFGTVWADMGEVPPIYDQSSALGGGELVLVNEYGGTVNDPANARRAVECMGEATAALLAGHGVFVLGGSARAVHRARRSPRTAVPARLARARSRQSGRLGAARDLPQADPRQPGRGLHRLLGIRRPCRATFGPRIARLTGLRCPRGGTSVGRFTRSATRPRFSGPAVAITMLTLCAVFAASSPATASGSPGHVLLVGTFHGVRGSFSTIQAAVDASKKGDWILIAPGDYHETADETPSAEDSSYASGASATDYSDGNFGGVLVDTPGITLRGMNRSTVIVDGTKAGAPKPCDPAPQYQNLGPTGTSGAEGRNGILIWKANNVSVENLTACNFLGGAGDSGNEVWWNGGANSGKIGLRGYNGSYLTATSTYFGGETTAAQYGIFSSNSAGTAEWNHLYTSNFNDSGMYVGACKQSCGIVIDNAWMEYSALGYSGTNSGGSIVIENSQFDNNEDGADTNTAISGDGPAPANGACPGNAVSHITHTRSCWVFMHNVVRDNNNIDTPRAGSAAAGPTGTGMTVSGAAKRHRYGQHILRQRSLGNPLRALPRQRHARTRPNLHWHGWRGELSSRVHLRPRGRRPQSQHVRQRRVLQEPVELRLRPNNLQRPERAAELLLRQQGPTGQLACRPREDPVQVRAEGARCEHGRCAPRPSSL